MGAPRRDRQIPRPRPVWVIRSAIGGHRFPPEAGLLLDWRQRESGSTTIWEGLVARGTRGGEIAWQLEVCWLHASEIVPMEAKPPY